MAEFPALPLFTDAYLGDTTHLTTLEHGAYLLLLMAAWRSKDTRLPDDDRLLARYAGLTAGQWNRIRPIIIRFFKIENGYLTQGRLTDEAKHVRQVSKRQSDKAKDRWLKTKETGDAVAMPLQCPPPHPTPLDNTIVLSPPTPKARVSVYPPQFETFWQTYPNRTGKAAAHKAYQAAIKNHGVNHEQLLNRAGQFAAAHTAASTPSQYIPHPATWLNGGRWEDDLSRIQPRSNGAPPAANARGSQFNALQSALSELMQEEDGHVHNGQPGLSEWGLGNENDLPDTGRPALSISHTVDRSHPASRKTVDYDSDGSNHG